MKKILLVLLAIGLLASTAGCGSQAAAAPVAAAEESRNQNVEAFGLIKATAVKNITLDFQAPVTKLYVKEGERVKSGQPLVALDLSEMENMIADKNLSLSAAKNNISRSFSNTDLKKLQNDQKNAQAIYDKDVNELNTKQSLYSAGSIPFSELDSFRKQLDSDKKNLQDIAYAIENQKTSKGTENDQKSLESSLLESDLKLLNSRLAKTYIKGSDIISDMNDGLVYDLGYAQGDIAGPQKKLLSIMNLDTLVVEANIPEEFISDVKIGSSVSIIPTADKTRKYTGKVSYISGIASNNNGETQIPVNITVDNLDEFLLPGFNVDVSITADGKAAK